MLEFRDNFLWTKTDVSEEHIASFFTVEEISSAKTGKVLLSDSFRETVKSFFVGFEVFTAVVMKSIIFWIWRRVFR
jgi:hypothetical protein